MACLSHVLELFLECDVLKSRKRMYWNRVDRMRRDPRPNAYETTQVHDGGEHDSLNGKLLDAMQQGFAFCTVPLNRLLFKDFIDIGIATIGVGALRIHKSLSTRGGTARSTNRRHNDPSELFVAPGREKCGALHGAQAHPNTHGIEVIDHCFCDRRKPRVGCEVASIKAIAIAGLSQELLGFLRIVGKRFGWQGEVHDSWHNDSGRRTEPQARCLIDRLPIEGVIDSQTYALISPGGFRVPLLGELEPEYGRMTCIDQGHFRITSDLFGDLSLSRGKISFLVLQHRQPC